MRKTKLGRAFALAMAFVMVFATITMFNTMQVQAAPSGDVLRVELNQPWGSIGTNVVDMTAGNEYTVSFWFMNTGSNNDISVQGAADPWPDIYEAPSPAGSWVWHEFKFTVPAGQTRIQAANPYPRVVGDVFYISAITITDASGARQTFAPGTGFQNSGADSSVVPAPAGPSVGGPANPQTGDTYSAFWLVMSGVALVASMAALTGIIVHKKKK
jgi:LPXTG-motif cell wall-anchored protein